MSRTYRFSLKFRSPVSIFDGQGAAGLVDRTVVRDESGLPFIPGSSVKGRLRYFAERALRSNQPSGYTVHPYDQPFCRLADSACTLCLLFGAPAIRSKVVVGSAYSSATPTKVGGLAIMANPILRPDADVRTGIALSRRRRIALPEHLFSDETIPAGVFEGSMIIAAEPAEIRFVIGVGRLVDALGARKAAGRGVLCDGIRIEPEKSR